MSEMSDARIKAVKAEARRLYPPDSVKYVGHPIPRGMQYFFSARAQAAFKRGRTVTAEQVEAAAKAVCRAHQDMDGDYPWDIQFEDGKEEYRDWARAALTAAGLLVEGGDHE